MFTEHVLPRIQNTVQVQGPTSIAAFSTTPCDRLVSVPTAFRSQSTDTDLILIMQTVNSSEDYLAYATSCSNDRVTGRPNVGLVAINLRNTNLTNLEKETFAYTIIHEIHHILIMSPSLFPFFYQVNYTVARSVTIRSNNGTSTQLVVVSPNVVAAGKAHFGCSTFVGIPLENQGGSGSEGTHWEKIYLGNELMTAQMTGKPVYSVFTLALMQDSNWYRVDTSQADQLVWGKNQGCSFYDYSCSPSFAEFCPRPTSGVSSTFYYCSRDYTSKNMCISTDFTDNCHIKEYLSNFNCNANDPDFSRHSLFESPGINSRCFSTTYNNRRYPGCYKSACVNGQVVLTISNQTITCPSAGSIISDGSLSITCPDPTDFCSYLGNRCLNDCSGHGRCMNGGCFCDFFYAGADCSSYTGCNSTSAVCNILSTTTSGNNNGGSNWPFSVARLGGAVALSFLLLLGH
jgi:leishmanolysin